MSVRYFILMSARASVEQCNIHIIVCYMREKWSFFSVLLPSPYAFIARGPGTLGAHTPRVPANEKMCEKKNKPKIITTRTHKYNICIYLLYSYICILICDHGDRFVTRARHALCGFHVNPVTLAGIRSHFLKYIILTFYS